MHGEVEEPVGGLVLSCVALSAQQGSEEKTKTKKKPRCTVCRKKLGVASVYDCKCSGSFCAEHRYPECHSCPHDYKKSGRQFLAANKCVCPSGRHGLTHPISPVVTAPKLPKI